jgi:hypothetical protein
LRLFTKCEISSCVTAVIRGIVAGSLWSPPGSASLQEAQGALNRMSRTNSRAGRALHVALTICLAVGLAGCGWDADPGASITHVKKAPASKPGGAVDRSTVDMVNAVSPGKGGPPVQLKFELRGRPQVGQPVDVEVALVPIAPNIDRLQAVFQPGDGLEVVSGAAIAPVEKPPEGVPIRETLTVLPKRDGIFTVTALVSVDSDTTSLVRTFSIPLIAGAGLPELAAKSEGGDGATPGTKARQ